MRTHSLAVALFGAAFLISGCPATGDDDDSSVAVDDDDDATADDDDDTPDERWDFSTFDGSFTVSEDAPGDDDDSAGDDDDSAGDDDDSAGDDDDSAGDDDDSAGDDDDSAEARGGIPMGYAVGEWVVSYWDDLGDEILGCTSVVKWSGTVTYDTGLADPECTNCGALLAIDPDSLEWVNEAPGNESPCTATVLEEKGFDDFAALMLEEQYGGVALTLPLIDNATAVALELTPGGRPVQMTIDGLAEPDDKNDPPLELSHIAYIDVTAGTFDGTDFTLDPDSEAAPDGGPNLRASWAVTRDPALTNHPLGQQLLGDYDLSPFYLGSPGL
ncbi:MAG: hypothetical protein KDA24_26895 [Deltaproteobacteria bacterium]|nr:hypothetical protein [Deltaproteobacteria bacterium]